MADSKEAPSKREDVETCGSHDPKQTKTSGNSPQVVEDLRPHTTSWQAKNYKATLLQMS